MPAEPLGAGDNSGARRRLWRGGGARPVSDCRSSEPTPATRAPSSATGRQLTKARGRNNDRQRPPPGGDLRSRLGTLRQNLSRYQELKTDRQSKLNADIVASENLLTQLNAKVRELKEDTVEDDVREAIAWVEVEISAPMRLERQEEIAEILAGLEEQCEHGCEMYDVMEEKVSRSTSPRSGVVSPFYDRRTPIVLVSSPGGSMISVSPPEGRRLTVSADGSRDVSPAGDGRSSTVLLSDNRSRAPLADGARRAVFSLDGSSSGRESPLDGSSGTVSYVARPRRSLVRSVASACSRSLRRSGSLPAHLPKAAIAAPLPAPVRPRFFLRFSTGGGSSSGGGEARVVVETRPEAAPLLARLFAAGCEGPYGGSRVLRCVPGWWLQAGPDGSGGAAATAVYPRLAETHAPRLETRPGAVELLSARLGAEHDDGDGSGCVGQGGWLVGPQFFIHLRSYSFTNVLGYVVEGLEQVARLASSGDPLAEYAPRRPIWIAECGRLSVK